jgi:hypothetical protein
MSMDPPDNHSQEKKNRAGRLTIRLPASLHDELAAAAENDGVSLNQFVCALLAGGMRWRHGNDESGSREELPEGHDRVSEEEYRRIWRNAFG